MKSPKLLSGLAATWVAFILFDGATALMRAWYLRKMKNPFRTMYAMAGYGRSFVVFALAVANIALVMRELKKDQL